MRTLTSKPMIERILATAVSVIAALAMALTTLPAFAGSEDHPEMEGECAEEPITGGGGITLQVTVPWLDLCSAWFDATLRSTPGDAMSSELVSIQTTLLLATDVTDRPPSADYGVWWDNGDCVQGWRAADTLTGDPDVRFFEQCPGDEVANGIVLEFDDIQYDGSRITVEIDREALDILRVPIEPGSVLKEPLARADIQTSAPPVPLRVVVEHDRAGPGRDYHLPTSAP